jgi:hypothetical protein
LETAVTSDLVFRLRVRERKIEVAVEGDSEGEGIANSISSDRLCGLVVRVPAYRS